MIRYSCNDTNENSPTFHDNMPGQLQAGKAERHSEFCEFVKNPRGNIYRCPPFKLVTDAHTQGVNVRRTAVAVIPRIRDVLEIRGDLNVFTDLNSIISFHDLFPPII